MWSVEYVHNLRLKVQKGEKVTLAEISIRLRLVCLDPQIKEASFKMRTSVLIPVTF